MTEQQKSEALVSVGDVAVLGKDLQECKRTATELLKNPVVKKYLNGEYKRKKILNYV